MISPPIEEPVPHKSPNGGALARLTPAELDRAVHAVDPAAFLVLPRILRRVIKHDHRLTGFGLRVPHRKSYVIGRDPLLDIVDKAELGLAEDAVLPETVVLLTRPDPRKLAATPAGDVLARCWRLLFHARIHAALDSNVASGQLGPAVVRRRIQQIGTAEFEEVRMVLGQEDLLLPPRSELSIYEEFVAVFLELRYFARSFLPRFFPGLMHLATVEKVVGLDVDAERLFRTTRPEGAPDPKDRSELVDVLDVPTESELQDSAPELPAQQPSEAKYRLLMRRSQRPASQGNVVRAAIYRARAEGVAVPEFVDRVHSAIKMDVYRLVRRLQAALELDDVADQPWQESLLALVYQTPRGIWTAEAKLLYDLQKVCIDHEREIYTVDLVEWGLTWGRRPIRRQLPNQRDVLMLRHLRSAAGRLAAVRLSDQQRRQLAVFIHDAMQRVETRLGQRLRPQITAALDDVGLVGQNVPERVARKKLVEELLDRVGERGFLTMGDLRDAISRNNLKLPDLAEPHDLLRGDQLLRADRKLALVLDGVYRRGEFYLRWMQRISSLGFGTSTGRFLTRFAVVPFSGAYVALAGLHHLWELVAGAEHPPIAEGSADSAAIAETIAEGGFRLTSPTVVLALGLFLLCLVNSASFRRTVGLFFKHSYGIFRAVVIRPIQWLVQWPLLQRMLHSRLFTLSFRFFVKPLLWTCVAWLLLPREAATPSTSAGMVVSIFLVVNLLLNSRVGRNLEEVVLDGIVQGWHRFGLRAITGLFWLIVDVFKGILETVERLMYSVDEWLRFKSGESNTTLAAKAALGFGWFFVAYVLRFCVNVLIEPQINPIKHFPVVTVSHKLLLPLIPSFAVVLELTMEKALAWTVAATTVWSIPGVFGFLVWELKENWRLYAANRRPALSPVPIGSHGETMVRLVKPGFHSGTLPKRYAKLRRAERRARNGGSWRSVHKQLQALDQIEVSIHHYVQREFLELLAESRCWQAPPVTLERVRLGTNSVRLAIACPGIAEASLKIVWEVESGWLVAGIGSLGWVEHLRPSQRDVLVTALHGLYKSAGIDLVRQQVEAQFAKPMPAYDISATSLVLWPDDDEDVEVLYDLHDGPWIAPQSVRGLPRRSLPTVERRKLVFSEIPMLWQDWVVIWAASGSDFQY